MGVVLAVAAAAAEEEDRHLGSAMLGAAAGAGAEAAVARWMASTQTSWTSSAASPEVTGGVAVAADRGVAGATGRAANTILTAPPGVVLDMPLRHMGLPQVLFLPTNL